MSDVNDTPAGYHFEVIDPPAGLEHLRCRLLVPDDFQRVPLPPEAYQVDFSDPTKLMLLGVFAATTGPMIIAVSARPAYDDGTMSQWLSYLCSENKHDRGEITSVNAAALNGVQCDAAHLDGDGESVRSRIALFCDGGRLMQVAGSGPEPMWRGPGDAHVNLAARSFELASVTGQGVEA
jgi:hypothetical protein